MTDMMWIIEWLVVPVLLVTYLGYVLLAVPEEETPPLVKASAHSGKGAALMVLALFIVSRKASPDTFNFQVPTYEFDFVSTILATVAGLVLARAFRAVRGTHHLGLFCFALTSLLSITLYSYCFIATYRSRIVFWTLGVVLGLLLHRMVYPELEDPPTGPAVEASEKL